MLSGRVRMRNATASGMKLDIQRLRQVIIW